RDAAATHLAESLDGIYCAGVHTNERWLARILRDERFLEVRHSVTFLQESGAELQHTVDPPAHVLIMAALVATQARGHLAPDPWEAADGFPPNLPSTVGVAFRCRDRRYEVDLVYVRGVPARAVVGGAPPAHPGPLDLADNALTDSEVAVRL